MTPQDWPRLGELLRQYGESFDLTIGDLAEEVQSLVHEGEAPTEALHLVAAYQAEAAENRLVWGGRNDMDAAEELMLSGLNKLCDLPLHAESVRAPTAVLRPGSLGA